MTSEVNGKHFVDAINPKYVEPMRSQRLQNPDEKWKEANTTNGAKVQIAMIGAPLY